VIDFFDLAVEEPAPTRGVFFGRTFHRFNTKTPETDACCTNEEYCCHAMPIETSIGDADIVSSILSPEFTGANSAPHAPVIDLDFPCQLVESGTPGHYHLYIDKEVPWDKYIAVLDAMVDAGLVQGGYVAASKVRGYTAVRVPWRPKGWDL
jgi:hypothetical protein